MLLGRGEIWAHSRRLGNEIIFAVFCIAVKDVLWRPWQYLAYNRYSVNICVVKEWLGVCERERDGLVVLLHWSSFISGDTFKNFASLLYWPGTSFCFFQNVPLQSSYSAYLVVSLHSLHSKTCFKIWLYWSFSVSRLQ